MCFALPAVLPKMRKSLRNGLLRRIRPVCSGACRPGRLCRAARCRFPFRVGPGPGRAGRCSSRCPRPSFPKHRWSLLSTKKSRRLHRVVDRRCRRVWFGRPTRFVKLQLLRQPVAANHQQVDPLEPPQHRGLLKPQAAAARRRLLPLFRALGARLRAGRLRSWTSVLSPEAPLRLHPAHLRRQGRKARGPPNDLRPGFRRLRPPGRVLRRLAEDPTTRARHPSARFPLVLA